VDWHVHMRKLETFGLLQLFQHLSTFKIQVKVI
jgi:hypothetical protein